MLCLIWVSNSGEISRGQAGKLSTMINSFCTKTKFLTNVGKWKVSLSHGTLWVQFSRESAFLNFIYCLVPFISNIYWPDINLQTTSIWFRLFPFRNLQGFFFYNFCCISMYTKPYCTCKVFVFHSCHNKHLGPWTQLLLLIFWQRSVLLILPVLNF